MSFSLVFARYDHEVMSLGIGSGDESLKSAIDREFYRRTSHLESVDLEWQAGRLLAHQVIEEGFPRISGREQLRHRLAAEWLTTIFRIPGSCRSQNWRWSTFYDTLHTVPGFSEAIGEPVDVLETGRPFFGEACPEESYYGYLTRDECRRVLEQCQKHKADFETHEEARHCIGPLIELFQWATAEKSHLWFGFW